MSCKLSDKRLPRAVAGDNTYPIPVIVVDMALLERALDLLLGVLGQDIETVDQLKVVLSGLPPVVKDIWRDTAPVADVSNGVFRGDQTAQKTLTSDATSSS